MLNQRIVASHFETAADILYIKSRPRSIFTIYNLFYIIKERENSYEVLQQTIKINSE